MYSRVLYFILHRNKYSGKYHLKDFNLYWNDDDDDHDDDDDDDDDDDNDDVDDDACRVLPLAPKEESQGKLRQGGRAK